LYKKNKVRGLVAFTESRGRKEKNHGSEGKKKVWASGAKSAPGATRKNFVKKFQPGFSPKRALNLLAIAGLFQPARAGFGPKFANNHNFL
jgi:hypothetical protein